MVTWFARKRDALETAPAVAEEADSLRALLATTHLPVAEVDEQFGVVPAGVRATVDERTLAVVVEQVHPPRAHDRALAFGLAAARGRRLALLLPAGDDAVILATRSRTALLRNVPIDLYTYDDLRAVVHPPLSERMMRSGAGESDGLERAEEYQVPARLAGTAAPIEAWANHELDLTPQHLKSARAWVCEGQRVLSMRATRSGLRVVAGVRDDSLPDPEPLTLTLTGVTPAAQVDAVIVRVEAAIARRRSERAPGYREYRIAATLERVGRATDWGAGPVCRQVRGMRPGGGHARVPFVRVDAEKRLHVVEVAHHRTGLLGIRALDAWIWATENKAALADLLGVPSVSSLVLDVVVAVGPGMPCSAAGTDTAPAVDRPEDSEVPRTAADLTADEADELSDDEDAVDDADEDLDETSSAAVPTPVLAQLGALSATVVWEAQELSAWDTEHPVLRTTVRSGVPVVAERVPLMPASLTAIQEFLQLVGPGAVSAAAQARSTAAATAMSALSALSASAPSASPPSVAALAAPVPSVSAPSAPVLVGPAHVGPALACPPPSGAAPSETPPASVAPAERAPSPSPCPPAIPALHHEPRPDAAATMAR